MYIFSPAPELGWAEIAVAARPLARATTSLRDAPRQTSSYASSYPCRPLMSCAALRALMSCALPS
eukprot:scaffold139229_cov127-Phaeocystis_antarctica.AAC.2